MKKQIDIEKSWSHLLNQEFKKEYFLALKEFVREQYQSNVIYPKANRIFNAFNSSLVDNV